MWQFLPGVYVIVWCLPSCGGDWGLLQRETLAPHLQGSKNSQMLCNTRGLGLSYQGGVTAED
jgi:hypothetical protein